MGVFNTHQSLLCTALTFSQSKAVYRTGQNLLEFQPAILGTGEVLTICTKIKIDHRIVTVIVDNISNAAGTKILNRKGKTSCLKG